VNGLGISVHRWKGVAALLAAVVLVASGCSKGRSGSGVTAYNVFAQKFRFSGMPSSVPAGNMQLNFSNRESFPIIHEMIVAAMPAGKTTQDIMASAKVKGCTGGGPCESQYLHFGEVADVDTGATVSSVFNLPAGTYFFACWQQGTPAGKEDGPTHASIGMVYQFTVT